MRTKIAVLCFFLASAAFLCGQSNVPLGTVTITPTLRDTNWFLIAIGTGQVRRITVPNALSNLVTLPTNTICLSGPTGYRWYYGFLGLSNAFVNMANNDVMDIGPGTYSGAAKFNTPGVYQGTFHLTSKSNLVIRGHNATLVTTNYGFCMTLGSISNVTLSGLTFQGDIYRSATGYAATNWLIGCEVATVGVSYDITIRDCRFIRSPNQAISFLNGGATRARVLHNYFEEVGQTNVADMGNIPDGAAVSGICTESDVIGNRGSAGYFFEWDGGQAAGLPARNVLVSQNTVRVKAKAILVVSIVSTNTLTGLKVENNTFDAGDSITEGGLIYLDAKLTNAVFAGNTLRKSPAGGTYHLLLFSSAGVSGYANLEWLDNTAVEAWSVYIPAATNAILWRTKGAGVPSLAVANGSTWFRTDGGAGTTVYSREANAWTPLGSGTNQVVWAGTNGIAVTSTNATDFAVHLAGPITTVVMTTATAGTLIVSNIVAYYSTNVVNGVVVDATSTNGVLCVTSTNYAISGFSNLALGKRQLTSLTVSNSSGSTIYVTNSPTTYLFGTASTNIVAIAAAKEAYFDWEIWGGTRTNGLTLNQQ